MNGVSFNTVSNLVDTYMKDAKFNENSGYVLQRVWQGSESNIRLLWYSPLGMSNRSDGGMTAVENTAFWRSMNDYVDGNRAYFGRVLSWKQGAENQNNMNNFSVIVFDPVNFKEAHDKIVDKLFNSAFKDRTIGLGTYDIGRPDGATHWVSLSGTSNSDIISLYDIIQNKYSKEMSELFKARQFSLSDFKECSHIFVMDRSNYKAIIAKAASEEELKKINFILNDQEEVPDPYYGGPEGFQNCFTLLEDACDRIVKSLENE